ncbi:MAG: hypothetical protein RM338_34140 [Nostoc sp. DedQUE12a]|nr:hypothetical protein [Nostoc sp. DedQUE12a]
MVALNLIIRVENDRHGRTYESIGLRPEQIMVLHFEPASPDSVPEMVTA